MTSDTPQAIPIKSARVRGMVHGEGQFATVEVHFDQANDRLNSDPIIVQIPLDICRSLGAELIHVAAVTGTTRAVVAGGIEAVSKHISETIPPPVQILPPNRAQRRQRGYHESY